MLKGDAAGDDGIVRRVSAAEIEAAVVDQVRTLLRQQADLSTVVSELNNLIYRNAVSEKFITAFFGIYNRGNFNLCGSPQIDSGVGAAVSRLINGWSGSGDICWHEHLDQLCA